MNGVSVMVVYEDKATELRAGEFRTRFQEKMAPFRSHRWSLWMLNLLRTPSLQEQAAVEASRADVIVLSVCTKAGLPSLVQKWLARWLDHKENRAYTLGVLLEPGQEEAEPIRNATEHMRGLASATGASFFCWESGTQCDFAKTFPMSEVDSFANPLLNHTAQNNHHRNWP